MLPHASYKNMRKCCLRLAMRPTIFLFTAILCVLTPVLGIAQGRKKADLLMEQGLAAEASGNNKAAFAAFDELLRSGGDGADPKALYHRGLAYSALGDQAKAMQDYDRAVALHYDYSPLYISRASLLLKQGQNARAADD